MNRYPVWANVLIALVVLAAFIIALPNLYGEGPAVQVSPARLDGRIDAATKTRIHELLQQSGNTAAAEEEDGHNVLLRFATTDQQIHARDVLQQGLNSASSTGQGAQFNATLNLMPLMPHWLRALGVKPMYLGLDLRGGVHFLLQIDQAGAIQKRLESVAADARSQMRSKRIRYSDVSISDRAMTMKFSSAEARAQGRELLATGNNDFRWEDSSTGGEQILTATYTQPALLRIQEDAIRQNMTTLNRRVNELGVAEPLIQQQGANRIVVQLAGVQDTARAKEILGRTATLEVRMVDDDPGNLQQAVEGRPPAGFELYREKGGRPILLNKQVMLTGERLTDAQQGFDEKSLPAVNLTLDGAGARIFQTLTHDNVNKRMAILLVEKSGSEVVTAPVIRGEIPGGHVQISGSMSNMEAHDTALLLRAGALAAPMEIVEERTVGPSLGADNISRGFHSTLWGFFAIAVFMIIYYMLFGLISVVALFCNLVLLIALLSILQATLTLPGIAAIALTLGMAIDANVLINERIREELRNGATPQAAIHAGYDRAFATILDSNITTLIAGLALLIFGSGPVRGFAVVHCLGILTSMFSAILISRALVNATHGNRRLTTLAIGQIWRPNSRTPSTTAGG